jgi:quercetin dioxygenase-like cupin family protein
MRYRWDEQPLEKVTEMVARKTLGGAELLLTQAYFKKGARVPLHAHAAEQLVYVLQGVVRIVVGGEDRTLREGELLVVPPSAPHQVEVLDDAFVLTVARA